MSGALRIRSVHASIALAAVVLATSLSAGASQADNRFLQRMDTAQIDRIAPDGTAVGPKGTIRLPGNWPGNEQGHPTRLTFTFQAPHGHRDVSVFVEAARLHFLVRFNGTEVFATTRGDPLTAPRLRSWRMSPEFSIPADLLRSGTNQIELISFAPPKRGGGLAPVWFGDADAISGLAFRVLVRDTVAPLVIAAVIATLGFFALVLARGQADPRTFVLFGLGAILWGLHTAVTLLPETPIPFAHYVVFWYAGYAWFVSALSLFCVRFAGLQWRWFGRFGLVFSLAAVPIMYGIVFLGAGALAYGLFLATCIGMAIVALFGVMRFAFTSRSFDGAMLLAVGLLSVSFSVYDWLKANVWGELIKEYILTPYAGLSFIFLAGWMLVDRYQRTASAFEDLNRTLERRVVEANAELRRQLDEVRAAREVAEQASVAKSKFFAAASHDLRQPLHSLGMFASALDAHLSSDEGRELRRRIGSSIEALESLFNELLDLSRLDAGVIEPRVRPLRLQNLFDRLDAEFHRDAEQRRLNLRFVPTTSAVMSDPVLLERIVANLVSNALRYTERGSVLVGARRRAGAVVLEVRDSGIGIAAADQDRIFDEFYQVNNPARDRRRGLGLGLAIVSRLTKLLDHPLQLQSAPGRGTIFRLSLPLSHAVMDADAPSESPLAPSLLQGKAVLVVDDEVEIRDASVALLSQWGIRTIVAADPAELTRLLDTDVRPDAAIVDLRLGGAIDGVDVVALLRRRFGPSFPALLISGDTGARELARVKASGLPLLIKPAPPARLKAALHACLSAAAGVSGS